MRASAASRQRRRSRTATAAGWRLTLVAGFVADGELRVVAHYHWLQAPRHQAQDAVGLAYSAALLTETGEELVSQRHLIDQGGETRQLKNAAHPLGWNAAGTVIPAGQGTQRRGYLAKSFRLNSREPTTVSLYVQLVHQSRFINLPYRPPLSLCAPHGASSGPEGRSISCLRICPSPTSRRAIRRRK